MYLPALSRRNRLRYHRFSPETFLVKMITAKHRRVETLQYRPDFPSSDSSAQQRRSSHLPRYPFGPLFALRDRYSAP